MLMLLAVATGCDREERRYREIPAASNRVEMVSQSQLQPGEKVAHAIVVSPYDENAWAVSEGKRYYQWYNCSGCHAHGGGSIGPPLMDDKWIYGSSPENIFQTIVEGRPNGMPSFRGKIPDAQLWQLVSYVRSMSGLLRKDVTGGRGDEMQIKQQEQSKEEEAPVQTSVQSPSGSNP